MATKSNRLVPFRAIHPGEILREELRERGIKQRDFAQAIGVKAPHLNEFIKGKRNLNEDLALKLEQYLNIPYKTWMDLHHGYVYDNKTVEKRKTEEQDALQFESACEERLNLKLLYKELEIALLPRIERVGRLKELFPFDLRSVQEMNSQVAGLYKHSAKVQIDEKNLQTWLVLNWLQCSKVRIDTPYRRGNGLKAAEEISRMANARDLTAQRIQDCLNRNGIAFIHLNKIDKVPVDAYSTILNNHPIVTVTYRYNDMDKLAFDILHELCHIEKHLSDEQRAFIALEGTLYSTDPREKEANDFAKQSLIPDRVWSRIMKVGSTSLSPHRIVKTIAQEAERLGISPSIAVSRYKHDTNWYQTSAYKSPKIY